MLDLLTYNIVQRKEPIFLSVSEGLLSSRNFTFPQFNTNVDTLNQ